MLTPNDSYCRKWSVIAKQSRNICAASFFDVIIDKIYEAGIEEMLKFIVRILTKNMISYYAYSCVICNNDGPGVAQWLRRCATSWTVRGSIPGSVTGDFFRGTPDRTICPEVNSASESEYQGFLLG